MRRLLALLVAIVCCAGCGAAGSGGDPEATLRQTAAKLGDIHSGTLDFRLAVNPKGTDTEKVGWELHGPFELGRDGRPTTFQMTYTQRRGDADSTVTVTSTGGKAYVTLGDEVYEVPSAQAQTLTRAGTAIAGGQGLGALDIRSWLRDSELSGGDDIGGDATDRIRADLDVAAAARDLVALARRSGNSSLAGVSNADARQLENAVNEASVEVLTGEDDRLLRRLRVQFELAFDVGELLRDTLGSLVGADVEVELTIEHPNEPVTIEAPQDAHPASDFPG